MSALRNVLWVLWRFRADVWNSFVCCAFSDLKMRTGVLLILLTKRGSPWASDDNTTAHSSHALTAAFTHHRQPLYSYSIIHASLQSTWSCYYLVSGQKYSCLTSDLIIVKAARQLVPPQHLFWRLSARCDLKQCWKAWITAFWESHIKAPVWNLRWNRHIQTVSAAALKMTQAWKFRLLVSLSNVIDDSHAFIFTHQL